MTPKLKKIETGRVCAVCGKRTSPGGEKDTFGFGTILRRNGYKVPPEKAHRECIASLPPHPLPDNNTQER